MARGSLSVQSSARTGTRTVTFTAANATDHHQFSNTDGKSLLLVNNASGGAINITITPSLTLDGITLGTLIISAAANAITLIGPFPTSVYNQAGDVVYVNVATAASLSLAAIKQGT